MNKYIFLNLLLLISPAWAMQPEQPVVAPSTCLNPKETIVAFDIDEVGWPPEKISEVA